MIEYTKYFASDKHPFDEIRWKVVDAVITAPDGTETFRQNSVEVPEFWSDRATKVVAEKYFRVVDGVKESSARSMFERVAETIRKGAVAQGVLNEATSEIFKMDLLYLMVNQYMAFNSPVWFNVGVVEHPQASACFIQSVTDTMDGITELAGNEMRLFKQGSGTGSNLSRLRSSYETLSGGGYASGVISFMDVFDSGAGATKSGGTTRRAAKMVCLDVTHPDILTQRNGQPGFIRCKSYAEQIAQDLHATGKYTAQFNVPGTVYDLVGFQNANNSVRVSDAFMRAVVKGGDVSTHEVTTGKIVNTYKARELLMEMAKAAWMTGCPGIQYDDTINKWHTVPLSGKINASNPCSEYMFLDDTACNLASLNLMRFVNGEGFDAARYARAVRTTIVAMDVLVGLAGYPTAVISQKSREFRPLGIGYANLGALFMYMGLPYDSNEARSLAGALTSLLSAAGYCASAHLAQGVGHFLHYQRNQTSMLGVVRKHAKATEKVLRTNSNTHILDLARNLWRAATDIGEANGFRNSQISVIAPTGTISFLMDCDTTGCEPMLGVVVYKKLVGGGLEIMPNNIVDSALKNLKYSREDHSEILRTIKETGDITKSSKLKPEHHAVFASALGDNAISTAAHLGMLEAIQPFVSGSISKTVNLPASATPQDIYDLYIDGWKRGLKCLAIFRDGCKLSQPISTKADKTESKAEPKADKAEPVPTSKRRRLEPTAHAVRQKIDVGGQEGYAHFGLYPDGTVGELFVRLSKGGSTLNGFVDMAATAASLALQYGAPVEELAELWRHMSFEPKGFVRGNAAIKKASSIADLLAQVLQLAPKGESTASVAVEPPPKQERKDFVGPPCSSCGNMTKRSGSCWVCTECGTTTGCG